MFDDSTCQLHMDIPPLKSYNHIRKDSESDLDDTGDVPNTTNYPTDNFNENIKHEFVPYDIPPELPKMETLPSLLFEENSQSLSESTISQNEIFNINDSSFNNLHPNFNSDVKEEDEDKSNMGFYHISESCTLVPNTSGLITINTISKDHKPLDSLNEADSNTKLNEDISGTSLISKLPTKCSLSDQLTHSESDPGPSRIPHSENESLLTEPDRFTRQLNIDHDCDVQKASDKKVSSDSEVIQDICQEVGVNDVVDMETETICMEEVSNEVAAVEERNVPDHVEELHNMLQSEMEVCSEEVLHMTDNQSIETVESQQIIETKELVQDM